MASKRNIALEPQQIQAIEQHVLELLEKTLNSEFPEQYFPVGVDFEKDFGHWNLRLYIDHLSAQIETTTEQKPVSIKNCEDISRLMNPLLDELKAIEPFSYNLEVSSPGLFRELKTEREFNFYKGRRIKIETLKATKEKAPKSKRGESKIEDSNESQLGTIEHYDPETKTLKIVPLSESEQSLFNLSKDSQEQFLITLNPEKSKMDDIAKKEMAEEAEIKKEKLEENLK